MLGLMLCANAQQMAVNKCIKKGGKVVYTSFPCAPGEASETLVAGSDTPSYDPPPVSDVARIRQVQAQTAQRDAELRGNAYGSARSTSQGAVIPINGGSRCEMAKQHRDKQLRALGEYGRRIEVRRSLDKHVEAECKF